MKFHWLFAGISGLGLLYAAVSRTRLIEGKNDGDPDIHSESLRIVDEVAGSVYSPPCAPGQHLSAFLERFGEAYPERLVCVLETFLECTEWKMGAIPFKAPLQNVVYGIVFVCKNIVENNLVKARVFGRLNRDFEKQLDLLPRCARCIGNMAASPWKSTKSAFAAGCVYAASCKIIYGLHNILERLRTELSKGAKCDETWNLLNFAPDSTHVPFRGMDMVTPSLTRGTYGPMLDRSARGILHLTYLIGAQN